MAERAIREGVARYIVGELNISQLEARLPDAWQLDALGDTQLRTLTFEIMGALGEFDRGDIDEVALRKRLVPLAGWIVTTSYSSSPAETFTSPRPARAFAVGTALPVGSG